MKRVSAIYIYRNKNKYTIFDLYLKKSKKFPSKVAELIRVGPVGGAVAPQGTSLSIFIFIFNN